MTLQLNICQEPKEKRVKMQRTQKIKKPQVDKKAIWENYDLHLIFEKEKDKENNNNDEELECIYNASNNKDNCEICSSSVLFTDEGFLVCTNKLCGHMCTDILDQSAEWRYYGSDDNQTSDPTRCGMPINPLLKESSFGCKVIFQSGNQSYEMQKIRRYTEWQSMPHKEKSLYDEFQRITIWANQAGIPKLIIDEAMRYHKKISEFASFRGLNRDGIIAATIYVAARINNYPRTAKEIATIFHLDNTSATRGCKNAIAIINELEHDLNNNEKTSLCQTTPLSFIDRYCSKLNFNVELTKLCKFIAMRIQKNNMIPENTPHSIAAGIVFFVSQQCNLNISKRSVNSVSEISEVTINKCYKKLELMKEQLMPKALLDKYTF
jgi:transcription initiation factor TFIIB